MQLCITLKQLDFDNFIHDLLQPSWTVAHKTVSQALDIRLEPVDGHQGSGIWPHLFAIARWRHPDATVRFSPPSLTARRPSIVPIWSSRSIPDNAVKSTIDRLKSDKNRKVRATSSGLAFFLSQYTKRMQGIDLEPALIFHVCFYTAFHQQPVCDRNTSLYMQKVMIGRLFALHVVLWKTDAALAPLKV